MTILKCYFNRITALLLLCSNLAWSNCPNISSVVYQCAGKHCNWTAPWYEGFPDSNSSRGMKAAHFIRVFWGIKEHSPPPQPGFLGSTICFYQSPTGDTIELVQNRWGGVLYPLENNWGRGEFQGHLGLECPKNARSRENDPSACHFNYP